MRIPAVLDAELWLPRSAGNADPRRARALSAGGAGFQQHPRRGSGREGSGARSGADVLPELQ